mmetsp:Transcript_17404/g.55913  ORF Transcript_17404/g.55913 Transcript_17404/m.55913 type:complete len:226 (-) Transcript_17404:1295-1972(-)
MGANLSVGPPREAAVSRAGVRGRRAGYNYKAVGLTRTPSECPPPWNALDHTEAQVGTGAADYEAAKKALQRWGHFQLGWTYVNPQTPVAKSALVCVVAKAAPFLPLWTTCPLEVVYTEEKGGAAMGRKVKGGGAPPKGGPGVRKFTFAHGCLGTHLLAGEERFSVEMRGDGSVWYEILTFSHAAHPISMLAYPMARWQQKRFARESVKAMKGEVQGGGGTRSSKN